jgi:hypothetical protein
MFRWDRKLSRLGEFDPSRLAKGMPNQPKLTTTAKKASKPLAPATLHPQFLFSAFAKA